MPATTRPRPALVRQAHRDALFEDGILEETGRKRRRGVSVRFFAAAVLVCVRRELAVDRPHPSHAPDAHALDVCQRDGSSLEPRELCAGRYPFCSPALVEVGPQAEEDRKAKDCQDGGEDRWEEILIVVVRVSVVLVSGDAGGGSRASGRRDFCLCLWWWCLWCGWCGLDEATYIVRFSLRW